jgi:hypothetical protein
VIRQNYLERTCGAASDCDIVISVTAANLLALTGLGLQTIAAAWLVKLEFQKGYIARHRQQRIDDLKFAIKARERLIEEVIAQTRATNALLAQGAPPGTPNRYSLTEAVASYVKQIDELERKREELKDVVAEEFPELRLLGAIILIVIGALLQVPLILK